MRRRDWLRSIIGWDGCMPILVACASALLDFVLPARDLAVLVIPIVAALIRTQHGHRQIARCVGRASLGRLYLGYLALVVPALRPRRLVDA